MKFVPKFKRASLPYIFNNSSGNICPIFENEISESRLIVQRLTGRFCSNCFQREETTKFGDAYKGGELKLIGSQLKISV